MEDALEFALEEKPFRESAMRLRRAAVQRKDVERKNAMTTTTMMK
jgi:hypothetical protein|tara:strand:+ start:674 stop:808 length:135 start_codon:yes stop_codon:yes gene_type:complete